jgi:hypothetical protein
VLETPSYADNGLRNSARPLSVSGGCLRPVEPLHILPHYRLAVIPMEGMVGKIGFRYFKIRGTFTLKFADDEF